MSTLAVLPAKPPRFGSAVFVGELIAPRAGAPVIEARKAGTAVKVIFVMPTRVIFDDITLSPGVALKAHRTVKIEPAEARDAGDA